MKTILSLLTLAALSTSAFAGEGDACKECCKDEKACKDCCTEKK